MFRVQNSSSTPTSTFADPHHVQGDILSGVPMPLGNSELLTSDRVGLPKKTQTYFFFQIDDSRVHDFRIQLGKLVPHITTTAQVTDDMHKIAEHKRKAAEDKSAPALLEMSGVNIVFSQKGLAKIGINDKIGDPTFDAGMLADAEFLGDRAASGADRFTPDWIPAFKKCIHGMILVSGNHHDTVTKTLVAIERIFGIGTHQASIHEVIRIVGDIRPGKEAGHEHFGFLDGISQPAIAGVDTKPLKGQETIRQGIILLGREGDAPVGDAARPSWALDGSFLAFRYLFQLVPEFDTFLKKHPIPITGLSPAEGSELLGARLVGRWKSGAPIDLTPTKDDPILGVDPTRNNDFAYNFPDDAKTQDRCPFAAHTRKTNPRADLEGLDPKVPTEPRRIIRRGIQFGPEMTKDEVETGKTAHGRGLLFASYQSNIANGFQFIQHSWANNIVFPPGKPLTPGFDPIIGQTTTGAVRSLSGTDPKDQNTTLDLATEWVVPKGGEYFFSPSIPALKETFALKA